MPGCWLSASRLCLRARAQDSKIRNCCFPSCCCPCCCCQSCQCRCYQRQNCGSRRCCVRYCPGCRRYTWRRRPGGTPPQSARSRMATSTRRQKIGQRQRQHPPTRPEWRPCSHQPWISLSACEHDNGVGWGAVRAPHAQSIILHCTTPAKGVRGPLADHVGHAAVINGARGMMNIRKIGTPYVMIGP